MKSTVSPRKPSIIALPSPRAKEKITHLIPAPRRRIQGVVGQEKAVAYLERELRNIEKGQPLPWFAFYDDLGLGKSHIVGAFMDALPKDIETLSINCKEKLNVTEKQAGDYFHKIRMALEGGVRTVIHLEEFGNKGGTGSLQSLIMAHISKIADNKPLAVQRGLSFPYDPFKLGFIISSFAPARAAVDIVDRIKQPLDLVLSSYSPAELVDILTMAIEKSCTGAGIPVVKATSASLMMIARSMRGNARQARDVSEEIRKSAADHPNFALTLETAEVVIKKVGVFPHGLNQNEVKLLKTLATGPKSRETLAAKTGVEKNHWTRAINFLQEGTGRGEAFQLCREDGTPVENANGSLVDFDSRKFHLTPHGKSIVALLQKKGWI